MTTTHPSLLSILALVVLTAIMPCQAEFMVVLPDSSGLVDRPQNGFSNLARTDPAEQRAVYETMAATGNAWATAIPDVCRGRWHGIECMPDRNDVYHVVSLSFGALSDDTAFPTCDPAHATLSPALLHLPYLRSLFFYRCFSGDHPQQIPAFLGGLSPSLRSLILRENGHVGPIPTELGNLTSLGVLDLHGNKLSSSIPQSLQRLTRLQLLDLSYNQLTGPIPDLTNPTLNVLDLSHNFLHGQIPATFGQCDSLIKMDLSRNRLIGSIPDSLSNLKSLILLDLSHNSLSGPLPSSLGKLISLRALLLNGNYMSSATIPEDGFAGLKELFTLVLSNMGLQGPIPESIGELPSLRVLHLDGNKFNGSIPQSFQRLEKLSELRLNDNRLSGPIPFSKEMLWRIGRKLRVYNNPGLCYDASNGRSEGIDSMSGISYCETETKRVVVGAASASISGHQTKHLSSRTDRGPPSRPSSYAPTHGSGILRLLVPITGFLLSVLPLL
ncbi:protein TOO MANY MOUTHS [Elaeis guineensis]|uniref:Protein TOO MANY MOUTHS n=1 Tax=Elaeis guineensis var. tenera TaxID=51953 RepID=A0A6I9QZ45_ELAGV|nr:protein TOO MANY MOUTHS [Elaeis guineensis]